MWCVRVMVAYGGVVVGKARGVEWWEGVWCVIARKEKGGIRGSSRDRGGKEKERGVGRVKITEGLFCNFGFFNFFLGTKGPLAR